MNFSINIDDIEEFIAIIRRAIVQDKMTDDQIVKCLYATILKNAKNIKPERSEDDNI